MPGSLGKDPSGPNDRHAASGWSKLRDFVTSTAGLVAGLATIMTAAAAIAGVVAHGRSQPERAAPHSPTRPAITRGTTKTDSQLASSAKARIQWGPGDLLITNDGTSLSTVPPGNNEDVVGDIYSGGTSFNPFAGTTLVLWTANAKPSAQQCQYLATTQGMPGQGVNVVPGSVVCIVTAEGPIAIIRVTSLDAADNTIETRATVWDLPGS
jgi:hypothetical protein